MAIEDRFTDSAVITVTSKLSHSESDKLDALVKEWQLKGKRVTRSSLVRAILGEYFDKGGL